MTVICWDGVTLASDRQLTLDGDLKGLTRKLARSRNGTVCGASGDAGLCVEAVNWVLGGMKPDARPAGDKDGSFDLIVVLPDGTALLALDNRCTMEPLPRKQWAIGSGAQIALGAMAMGADAERAVQIASGLTASCGGGVDALRPGRVKKP